MNYRITGLTVLALALLVAVMAASSTNGAAPPASQEAAVSSVPHAQDASAVHQSNLPANFSADDAYKQNCTRCHSEVPPMSTRRTKTIVRHMRVRANITAEEAEAILQYLTQ
jgi:cytochrome c5